MTSGKARAGLPKRVAEQAFFAHIGGHGVLRKTEHWTCHRLA